MPRITDDLTMSKSRVLFGRAWHEQYTPFGLLLTRTAEHFCLWSNTFSDNYVNGAMNRSLLHCVLPRPRRDKLPAEMHLTVRHRGTYETRGRGHK